MKHHEEHSKNAGWGIVSCHDIDNQKWFWKSNNGFFYDIYKTVFIQTFLTFVHYPNILIITYHFINNDQHNGLCHEAWSLDLVSTKSFGTFKKPLFEVWTMYQHPVVFTWVCFNWVCQGHPMQEFLIPSGKRFVWFIPKRRPSNQP